MKSHTFSAGAAMVTFWSMITLYSSLAFDLFTLFVLIVGGAAALGSSGIRHRRGRARRIAGGIFGLTAQNFLGVRLLGSFIGWVWAIQYFFLRGARQTSKARGSRRWAPRAAPCDQCP